MQRAAQTAGRLAKLTGLPKPTLESWRKGAVKKPRAVGDIFKVAVALRLTQAETNRLLAAADYPPLSQQLAQAQATQDDDALDALAFWFVSSPDTAPTVGGEPAGAVIAPFQAPPDLLDFAGRQAEITRLHAILTRPGSLCVLSGMGGVGKTSLAAYLAYSLRAAFPDGVLWVNLKDEPLSEEDGLHILAGFARAYGLDVRAAIDLNGRSRLVQGLLAPKRLLLVLDNAYNADAVRPFLLPPTHQGATLITTRHHQLLPGQALQLPLPPFPLTDGLLLLQAALGQRVAAEPEAAARLIQTLGGLPLALRIASRYLLLAPSLTLHEYQELLSHSHLDYLTDSSDASRDVRACFQVTFQALSAAGQNFFAQLALFEGRDFSPPAVAALTSLPLPVVKIELGELAGRSLVAEPAAGRYQLHPLLQAFAREKLGELSPAARRRLAHHYAHLADREGRANHLALDADWDHMQAALYWLAQSDNQSDVALFWDLLNGLTQARLGLVGYLDARGYWREARRWLAQPLPPAAPPLSQAARAFKQGAFDHRLSAPAAAAAHFQRALAWLTQAPPDELAALCRAYVCEFLAQSAQAKDFEEALSWCQQGVEALDAYHSQRLNQERGYLIIRQGGIWGRLGQFTTAIALTHQGLSLLPDDPTAAHVSGWTNLGLMHLFQGQLEEARTYWQEALRHAQSLGDHRRSADVLQNMAWLASKEGNYAAALAHYEAACQLYHRLGDVAGACRLLANAADDLMKLGRWDAAAQSLDQALSLATTHPHLYEEEVLALINASRWQLYQQAITTAPAYLQRADSLCRDHGLRPWQAIVWRVQAQLALAQGEMEDACAFINRSLEASTNAEEKGVAWRVKAEALAAQGDNAGAEAAFDHSLAILQTEDRFEYAMACQSYGQYHARGGRPEAARQHLSQALAVFRTLNLSHAIAGVSLASPENNSGTRDYTR